MLLYSYGDQSLWQPGYGISQGYMITPSSWVALEQKAIIGFCVVTFCAVLYLPVLLSYGSERLLFRRLDTRQEPLCRGLDRRGAGMY